MRIGILTSSRADFGIYLPFLKKLHADADFEVKIIAFGTHLSHFHGYTTNQIKSSGFDVDYTVESMLQTDSTESVAAAMGLTIIKFSSFWQSHAASFDLVFCIGDRYEMFSAVSAGIPFGIKFAHIHGGETSLGSIDNIFRHCITHISSIHFASTELYKERIVNMIDHSDHVYNVGALGLDNIADIKTLNVTEFKEKWGIDMALPTILTTFHPETVNPENNLFYINEIVEAIKSLKGYQFLITMPNADTAGTLIRDIYEKELGQLKGVFLIENLGTQSYFSAMKLSAMLLGNTSSGIIEAASFGKYVINIGNRQKGRTAGENVIHAAIEKSEILKAIESVALSPALNNSNLYYKNGAATQIIKVLKQIR